MWPTATLKLTVSFTRSSSEDLKKTTRGGKKKGIVALNFHFFPSDGGKERKSCQGAAAVTPKDRTQNPNSTPRRMAPSPFPNSSHLSCTVFGP